MQWIIIYLSSKFNYFQHFPMLANPQMWYQFNLKLKHAPLKNLNIFLCNHYASVTPNKINDNSSNTLFLIICPRFPLKILLSIGGWVRIPTSSLCDIWLQNVGPSSCRMLLFGFTCLLSVASFNLFLYPLLFL